MTRAMTTHPVAEGVTFVEGPASNWTVLVGDGEVALIDAGYPNDYPLVEESISAAGGAGLPVTTVLITHGHSDHIGCAGAIARVHGARVFADAAELPNIRREIVEQITLLDLLPSLWRPRVIRWAVHAIRSGGLDNVAVEDVRPLAGPFTVAGHRVIPIVTPGHTRGHTAFVLPDAEALVTGDALVAAHPTLPHAGSQLLPDMFHADPHRAVLALGALALARASVLLPGHGPLLRTNPFDAVEAARLARLPDVPRPTIPTQPLVWWRAAVC
ncbi:MBL fold metallo-hydrolase [Microbacterium sp. ET2]|uniref:MBL fold metallo-hydrolase n=1 Tax=Microbacterium albipurpureum TaxID=3050384 RepID=UPI00259CB3BC|nr:MBL fold metallo-hydrolase [Microbacterium sp. ET2 (Ac-2212)]WJL94105.1 MBL fold metallo-hydrolase [Microbacterium sp. ET2 (Ac-2212)]